MEESAPDAREGAAFLKGDKKHLEIPLSHYIRHFTGIHRKRAWQ